MFRGQPAMRNRLLNECATTWLLPWLSIRPFAPAAWKSGIDLNGGSCYGDSGVQPLQEQLDFAVD
jgi:hypothetical protein